MGTPNGQVLVTGGFLADRVTCKDCKHEWHGIWDCWDCSIVELPRP